MQPGLQAGAASRPAGRLGAALVVAACAVLLVLARPLAGAYLTKLAAAHAPLLLGVAALAAASVWALLWWGLLRRPALVAAILALLAIATAVLSGNLAAALVAALVLALTLVGGDMIAAWIRGREAGDGELVSGFAAGLVAASLAVLALGEAGILSRATAALALAAPAVFRGRRLPDLARRVARAIRLPRGGARRTLEAAWLAFVLLVLAAVWLGALCPDVSWDGLAYHLPEARAVAATGRLLPEPDLEPQSLLWRPHEAYLSLGFLFGGERVTRFLQFAIGVFGFGAMLSLARRIGSGGGGPLAALVLAAFPTAMLQLRATYVDWPAAFLTAAAAAELAGGRDAPGRVRLSGFLFGGAVATKVFALLAAPALLVLVARARPRPRAAAAAFVLALAALAPWLAWSARHAGSPAAPYAGSVRDLAARVARGHFFTTSPASGATALPMGGGERLARFARLPSDLVFRSSRFESNGDGYNGVLVLVAAVGLAGFDARRLLLFAAAALPALVPWSQLALPSVRYLFPLFPLYAVFVAEGLLRLTSDFSGRAGAAAGIALTAAAAAFPVQFGSSGLEVRVAAGHLSREAYLEDRLPAYPLWAAVRADDRLVFLGENDRFHCPAAQAWRSDYAPVAAWGRDPEAWRRGFAALGITGVIVREDRGSAAELVEGLAGVLEPVARKGPAVLYRARLPGGRE
ncbi:MAG TPA: hypothetical protein VMN82_09275 [Thermoanaerobaculia bacterium]|nr:hypothetical protein [Thermoanaerobaculia bacterium]